MYRGILWERIRELELWELAQIEAAPEPPPVDRRRSPRSDSRAEAVPGGSDRGIQAREGGQR
jgi:hypothetical protein